MKSRRKSDEKLAENMTTVSCRQVCNGKNSIQSSMRYEQHSTWYESGEQTSDTCALVLLRQQLETTSSTERVQKYPNDVTTACEEYRMSVRTTSRRAHQI